MKGLKDKVIIVTGGAGGIGSATCRRLAEEGAKVAIFDMNIAAAEQLAQDLINTIIKLWRCSVILPIAMWSSRLYSK